MPISFEHFISTIKSQNDYDATIIAANNRQTRMLRETISKSANQRVICAPNIVTFNTWAQQLWEQAQDGDLACPAMPSSDRMLSPFENSCIWERIVKEASQSDALPQLINKNELVRQIQTAYELSAGYRLKTDEIAKNTFDETLLFLALKKRYLSELRSMRATNVFEFYEYLIGSAKPEGTHIVYVYGFSDVAPIYIDVLASLFGSRVHFVEPEQHPDISVEIHSHASLENELAFAAKWASDRIHSDVSEKRSVAVVVPELTTLKTSLMRALQKYSDHAAYLALEPTPISNYCDVSAGENLDRTAIAKTAFLLPKLQQDTIERVDLIYLLQSPYWGYGYSAFRQILLKRVQAKKDERINLASLYADIQNIATQSNTDSLKGDRSQITQPDLFLDSNNNQIKEFTFSECALNEIKQLQLLRDHRERLSHVGPISEWVDRYTVFLKTCRFQGPNTLNSYEFQLVTVFITSLGSLKSLKVGQGKNLKLADFLSILRLKLQQTVFHAEVKQPRVQVLGLMEAAGIPFDECLVIGLTEHSLPKYAAPNPFLPIQLQKQNNMPKSSALRELEYAEQFLKTLIGSSKSVELSYHSENDDLACLPSPLLNVYSEQSQFINHNEPPQTDPISLYVDSAKSYTHFNWVPLAQAPTILKGERISGGAYHLDTQWHNPLFAFFRYRLNLKQERAAELGINRADRGSLLHRVLQDIYTQYPSKETVSNFLASPSATENIASVVKRSFRHEHLQGLKYSAVLLHFELHHLTSIVQDVLALDTQRSDNFIIHALEQAVDISLLGRSLPIRVDRIDDLEGERVVVDYKTGACNLGGLVKRTLQDYQLPLYAFAVEPLPSAVSYLQAKQQHSKYVGLGASHIRIGGVKAGNKVPYSELNDDWQQTLDAWKMSIEQRVSEIVNGEANYHIRMKSKQAFYTHFEPAVRPEERADSNG